MAGSSIIGALRVSLGLDSAQFQNGLRQSQSSAERFAKGAATAFRAVAAAAAAVAVALAAGIKRSLDQADDLSKLSAKIGIPIEELSKLKYAADLSGVSLDGLQTSVSRLSRNMADAARGTGEGAKAFQQLGISVTGSDGKLKSASQILSEMADRFSTLPDGAQKTALAMQLMGRSGADMIPLLNGGSSALNALLAEAKAFGLEISAGTGKAAEQFNDNVSRIGYAVEGVTLSLTAALAPALAVISDGMVQVANAIIGALDYLPQLAEYAAVAGGALALMMAPSLIASAISLTSAIAVGMVGAVRLLTAAMLANPLGAFVLAITAAVTAAYYFRDEIKKAIGVDVVKLAKDSGNFVIGAFVAAFESIRVVWNDLPAILGDAAVQAGNALIDGIEAAINAVIPMVRNFYRLLNPLAAIADASGNDFLSKALGTGALVQSVNIGSIPNPWSGAVSGAAGNIGAAVSEAMSTDYISAIGAAFEGATPGVQGFAGALGGANEELEALGGGGGKKGGKGEGSAKKAEEAMRRMQEAIESAKEALGQGLGNILDGLVKKSIDWKDALVQAGQALLKYLNQMNIAQGGKGLLGGGLVQGLLGGLLGFANGGSILPGGNGGIDGQVVAFRKSPSEQVDIYNPQTQGRSGGIRADVRVFVDQDGNWQAAVERIAEGPAAKAAGRVARAVPSMVDARNDERQYRRLRPRSG